MKLHQPIHIAAVTLVCCLHGCGGGSSGSPASGTPAEPTAPIPITVKSTSYDSFKAIGLTPQTLPPAAQWSLARGYADFSRRGVNDLFTATQTYGIPGPATPSRFEFWTKQPDGSYARDTSRLAAGDGCIHPRKALVADFNNDGRPDIFVACHGYDAPPFPGESNKIVLSQPDGAYVTQDASPDVGFFHGAAAADLNGDGYVDVVVVNNFDPESAFVLLNRGDGSFQRESGDRLPASLGGRPYFSVELVDVNEDGKPDLLLGGHEWEGAQTVVLINPGNNDFSAVTPVVLPPVAGEGVVLDFTLTGSGSSRTIWVLRTSGGDGTFYQSQTVQKVAWPSLTSTLPWNQRPKQWAPWLIPVASGTQQRIVSEDASMDISLPQ